MDTASRSQDFAAAPEPWEDLVLSANNEQRRSALVDGAVASQALANEEPWVEGCDPNGVDTE